MAFADSRLTDAPTWDEVKSVYGLRAPTIAKLKANDPHRPETIDPESGKRTEAGHLAWNLAGITTTDARQLWQVLTHEDVTDGSTDNPDNTNISVDRQPDTR